MPSLEFGVTLPISQQSNSWPELGHGCPLQTGQWLSPFSWLWSHHSTLHPNPKPKCYSSLSPTYFSLESHSFTPATWVLWVFQLVSHDLRDLYAFKVVGKHLRQGSGDRYLTTKEEKENKDLEGNERKLKESICFPKLVLLHSHVSEW